MGSWGEGRAIIGFARTGPEFQQRVEQKYSPSSGFLVGEPEQINLNEREKPVPTALATGTTGR